MQAAQVAASHEEQRRRAEAERDVAMAAERAGKGLQDTSTMTVPTTGALPDGPLPSGWVPGGFPTRKV